MTIDTTNTIDTANTALTTEDAAIEEQRLLQEFKRLHAEALAGVKMVRAGNPVEGWFRYARADREASALTHADHFYPQLSKVHFAGRDYASGEERHAAIVAYVAFRKAVSKN